MPTFSLKDKVRITSLSIIDRLRKKVAGRVPFNKFEVVNHYYHKFPDPPKNAQGKVEVNALGRRYYANTYPRWVMWDYTRPDRLFVNMDFILAAIEYEKGIKADKLVKAAAEAVIRKRCLRYLPGDNPEPGSLVLWYKPDSKYVDLEIDTDMWEPYKLFDELERS